MTSVPRWLSFGLLALVAARVLFAVRAAVSNTRGDYYASLPGPYVKTINPVLWDSPDMAGAWGYHLDTYYHGPIQYLTLYPVAYLDSYAAIAQMLLPIYVVVLGAAFWYLRAALRTLVPGITVPVLASTFLFFPLLQALIQREFEVVVFLGLCVALWFLLRDRLNPAAAALAYVAWFKYVPLVFVAYLAWRGWYRAVGVFVLTSAAIIALTQAVFGLEFFFNNNVPEHAAQVFNLWSYGFQPGNHGFMYGAGFCHGWIDVETTLANVRHGLCSLSFDAPWLPANLVYLAICAAVAVSYLVTHARLDRTQLDADQERWRRALEFSVVTTVYSSFLFNHYYYLIVLAIPLNVLLVRLLAHRAHGRLAAWAFAYVCLSAFVVPTSVLARLTGADVWAFYIKGAWFLWGELVLMALLLYEYAGLTPALRRSAVHSAATAPSVLPTS